MKDNKLLLWGAVVLLSFFGLLYPWSKVVAKSNSYYQYNMNIGEDISSINNDLYLDYSGNLANYQLQTILRINKEYRFYDLSLQSGLPFLKGQTREQDWRFNDYLLSIKRDLLEWNLGLVKPKVGSSFIYTGRMLGSYLKINNYRMWSGYSNPKTVGLSSQNKLKLGVSYNQDQKKAIYQVLPEENTYNHYISYSDDFSLADTSFWIDTTAGFNLTDQLVGIANRLRINSRISGLNYTVSGDYKAPNFTAVNRKSDTGYGSYGIDFSTYKQLGSYLVRAKLGYDRNNLNCQADELTKDWVTNWQLRYYARPFIQYYSKVNYNLKNNYLSNSFQLIEREKGIKTELGAEIKDLSLNFSYERNVTKIFEQSAGQQSSTSIGVETDYSYGAYDLNVRYFWDKQETWERNFNVICTYNKKIATNIDYQLKIDVDKDQQSLNQALKYNLSSNHQFNLQFNLTKSDTVSTLRKGGYFQYQYQF